MVNQELKETNNIDSNSGSPKTVASKRYMDMVRPGSVNPLKAKSPEKSKTLMRTVVSKPSAQDNKQVSQLLATSSVASETTPKIEMYSVPSGRQERAQNTAKSELISKFSAKQTETSTASDQSETSENNVSPLINVRPEPKPEPSKNIFEQSMAAATTENQLPLARQERPTSIGRHLVAGLAATLSVLIIGGFFVYQNYNRIDLYVASSKAGFEATSPSYNPSGYGLTNISSAAGVINTSYHSNSDARAYKITEKDSNWDNTTLLDSYVQSVAGHNYETYESGGQTIYLYGPGDATWVNGGIWYVVSSHDSLSNQQLIQIASSM